MPARSNARSSAGRSDGTQASPYRRWTDSDVFAVLPPLVAFAADRYDAAVKPLPYRSPAAWLCLLLPLVLGLGADLFTKSAAFNSLVRGTGSDGDGRFQVQSAEAQPIPGLLHLQAHVNHGAVFGIAQDQRVVFVVVSAFALGLLAYLFLRSTDQRLYQFMLGVLFAGVLGNLYDRVVFGYVRDMIHVFPSSGIFPWIFNIADSLLCTGVGGMFVYTLLRKDEPPEAPARTAAHVDPA
jgi:lipoprotein signal peptidase